MIDGQMFTHFENRWAILRRGLCRAFKWRQFWVCAHFMALSVHQCMAIAQSLDPPPVSRKVQFLQKMHELSETRPMTVEGVSKAFGWKLGASHRSKKLMRSEFSVTEDFRMKRVEILETSNYVTLAIELSDDWCVSSNNVLDVFGNKFRSLVATYDPYPENISSEVKKNMAKFLAGPVYRIGDEGLVMKVSFLFGLSECLKKVEIYDPKHYGANK